MNNRNLFMIINNQVKILPNTNMDHREWYLQLNLDINNFENIIRGYIMDNKIVFFKGSSFSYDNDVYKAALIYSPVIRNFFNNDTLEVCCGIMINGYNSKWEPILKIKDEEINSYTKPIEKQEEKEKEKKETNPIIEFKNDYEDPKFIRNATVVTSLVLVLILIIKIILFKEQKILQVTNPLDILLTIIQIVLLGTSIYGYICKKNYAKYLSLIASIFIVLTLDIFDIIIGILYFLFSIDQNYFIKLISLIKKIFKKKG
ncbi:MAG: hypothetical protein IJ097_02970 [Bacilli bacterium]|nr:hypothetical protein [Bacilli bacterium]